MVFPVAAMIGISALSAGFSIYSAGQQARAQRAAANAQAQQQRLQLQAEEIKNQREYAQNLATLNTQYAALGMSGSAAEDAAEERLLINLNHFNENANLQNSLIDQNYAMAASQIRSSYNGAVLGSLIDFGASGMSLYTPKTPSHIDPATGNRWAWRGPR